MGGGGGTPWDIIKKKTHTPESVGKNDWPLQVGQSTVARDVAFLCGRQIDVEDILRCFETTTPIPRGTK